MGNPRFDMEPWNALERWLLLDVFESTCIFVLKLWHLNCWCVESDLVTC